jgi:hypothetical protein
MSEETDMSHGICEDKGTKLLDSGNAGYGRTRLGALTVFAELSPRRPEEFAAFTWQMRLDHRSLSSLQFSAECFVENRRHEGVNLGGSLSL